LTKIFISGKKQQSNRGNYFKLSTKKIVLNNQQISSEKELRAQLEELIGRDRILDDSALLDQYSYDHSFVTGRKPLWIVQVREGKEIQSLVRWANQTSLPLIPVSSGPPHFRGDTLPFLGGVIVDLSQMKRVMRIDRKNRVAMIEPGVRFNQLQPELAKQGLRLMLPLCPRSTKSILACYLEREPTLIPKYQWDISDPLCCLEVVFGTGELFRTGSSAGPGGLEEQWSSGQAQKNPTGPGPSDFLRLVQGAQGTLGIVTWATIRLELMPSIQKLLMVGCEKVEEVIDFVYWLLRLRLGEECLILNRLNLASIIEKESSLIEELRANLPEFILLLVVAGYERFPEERVKYQTEDIKELAEKYHLELFTSFPKLEGEKVLFSLSQPSSEPYWKLRYKGSCAELFFLTTLDQTPQFIKTMKEIIKETGFDEKALGVYIQPLQQGRCCHLEFDLAYNPYDQTETTLTKETFIKASKALMSQGAFFSRPYGIWAEMCQNQYPPNMMALRKIKNIFDPNNVMNPGKIYL